MREKTEIHDQVSDTSKIYCENFGLFFWGGGGVESYEAICQSSFQILDIAP